MGRIHGRGESTSKNYLVGKVTIDKPSSLSLLEDVGIRLLIWNVESPESYDIFVPVIKQNVMDMLQRCVVDGKREAACSYERCVFPCQSDDRSFGYLWMVLRVVTAFVP